ncbi:hypothetical protein F8388_015268 [Cannabis sativa]|uniref:Ubiquitin-like protease family profile domain-containing protein n=1 Tax=Cannabis sativa TaxID=3483 RepID=A0A7J6F1I9_CANSA|nr:hypothetical protein F8388_015268 [Cannabis sativa]
MEVMSSGSQSGGDERDFKMVTYVKGLYALNDFFADTVSAKIEVKFDAWVDEGLLKHPSHFNCYVNGAKKFSPGFRLGVYYVEDKTYHLATCDMFINDSHMKTIFYYLRKKGKYSSAVTLNFAIIDCLFDDSIQALYHKFNKAKAMKTTMSHIHVAHPIAHYIRGRKNRSHVPDLCSDPKAPLRVVEIAGLPSQQKKNDCGAFVAAFAEFFIHGKDVPVDFDIELNYK